ncbi:acyl carrier protein [Actinoplanes derwentensis]|uniref:Acyl carrier protein n=1 Tax=Actinoplanes derwentensis TaxID=113562 RepID=A0A1H2DCT4_9ACTN|nr:acyl carrier protein [Actinoplanes derwentensis]GID89569.1 hypothetical protein Ade03nite_84930 [Actinoplanes derwentensis]SDT80543.1 Acyl carrier protein [Actinoplanes derwentensis]
MNAAVPPLLLRRLRETSTEGIRSRRWWAEQPTAARAAGVPREDLTAEPRVVSVPLTASLAADLQTLTGDAPVRLLALLSLLAGLFAAEPGDRIVGTATPDADGGLLPVLVPVQPGDSLAGLLDRFLGSLTDVLHAADGCPAAAAHGVTMVSVVEPLQTVQADWPLVLTGRIDTDGVTLRVVSRTPTGGVPAADRVARLVASLVDDPLADCAALIQAGHASESAKLAPVAAPGPASAVLGELAAIWCELLEVDSVQPDDDFFDLGGHSLLALELVAEIRERFTERMAMRYVFDCPTLTTLTAAVTRLSTGEQ